MRNASGALVMLRWIDEERVEGDVARRAIELAAAHPDSNVRVLFEKHIPESMRPKRLGDVIAPPDILALTGDAARGEAIFFKSSAAQCVNCHMVKGFGAQVGPDLSAIGKKYDRAALLETILAPSKAIAPEYVPYVIETNDGLVQVGFVVSKDENAVHLKDARGRIARLDSANIAVMLPQEKSLMPELVLRDVTAQDAADLLQFLTSLTDALPAGG